MLKYNMVIIEQENFGWESMVYLMQRDRNLRDLN